MIRCCNLQETVKNCSPCELNAMQVLVQKLRVGFGHLRFVPFLSNTLAYHSKVEKIERDILWWKGVKVNQRLVFPLSTTDFPLSAFRFPPQCYISVLPAGREGVESGKSLTFGGNTSRWFTLTQWKAYICLKGKLNTTVINRVPSKSAMHTNTSK